MDKIFENPEINYSFIKNLKFIYNTNYNDYKKKIIKDIIEDIKNENFINENIIKDIIIDLIYNIK